MKYTIEQIMKWKPCYEKSQVQRLVCDGLSAVGLAHLNIPAKDRVWVLIHMLYDVRGKDAVVDFAGNCALRAYYHADAAATCCAAAAAAAAAAADYYAARAAATDTTDAADYAYYAADYAADAATANAADAAIADDVERQWQIDYLVEAINETHM